MHDICYWIVTCSLPIFCWIQSTLNISDTDISSYPFISKNTIWTYFLFHLHFNFRDFKLLISQSKFSGARKFTSRYQWFGMNFNFRDIETWFKYLSSCHLKNMLFWLCLSDVYTLSINFLFTLYSLYGIPWELLQWDKDPNICPIELILLGDRYIYLSKLVQMRGCNICLRKVVLMGGKNMS